MLKLPKILLIAVSASTVFPAYAQNTPRAQAALQEQTALLAGIGSLHHPIATRSAEAQKFFDQGLALDYAFNHAEALRSFQRAAELDPSSPMPLWGIALALGPNYNEAEPGPERERAAYNTILKAKALERSAPENEQAYVNALAQRFTNQSTPDYARLGLAYAAAMRDLSRRYPDDPDAATLMAESLMDLHPWELWTNDGKPGDNTLEIVSALEGVLRRWPEHIGANHFYIHTLEAAPHPERALASAHRLETLAPAAGHLVHMPAHIYIRTGDYEEAVNSNRQAVAIDDADHRARASKTYVLLYSDHNLHFMSVAAMMDGAFATAIAAAKELEVRAKSDVAGAPMFEMYLPTPYFVLLRYGRWDDILAVPEPDAKLKGLTLVLALCARLRFCRQRRRRESGGPNAPR